MYIGIDFDGTCVTHEFPNIGKDIGAVPILKELVKEGHQLILFTMRSDKKEVLTDHFEIHSKAEPYLTEAVNWFKDNGIELYGIQTNPTQHSWTDSPKAYCHLYIDDASLGCPLIYPFGVNQTNHYRPFVDWVKVREMLVAMNYLQIN
jgi:hypothetical protein